MTHSVTLLFDVEDLCWPGSDDIVLDLAQVLARNGVRGSFFVVGEKARLWERRRRTDCIAALAPHDVGLHTDLHSIHPTVSEYLAPCGWADGVEEALRRDAPGFRSIERIFGRPASAGGQAGGTWGPQIHAALNMAGVPCAVYPSTCTPSADVHWYAGSLTFSGNELAFFDSAMLDAGRFDERMTVMRELLDRRIAAGQTWTGIFVCHPTMLRATQFWDQLNFADGRTTSPADYRMPDLHPEPAYRLALQNFETLVRELRADARLSIATIAELREIYRPPEPDVSPETLREAAERFVAAGDDLPIDNPQLSPAEAVYLMAQALLHDLPAQLARREIYGPIAEPPEAARPSLEWAELLAAGQALIQYVERNGQLPANVGTAAAPIGVGAFGRAAAAALLQRSAGTQPARVALVAGRQLPSIAQTIADRVRSGIADWPIHDPQIDTERLLLHTRLQCWTLRPAIPKTSFMAA
jgi:hypothetical protein